MRYKLICISFFCIQITKSQANCLTKTLLPDYITQIPVDFGFMSLPELYVVTATV